MRFAACLAALALFTGLANIAHAELYVFDPLGDDFPVNACLPSHAPVMFTTRYCDGAACPPDSLVPLCIPPWTNYVYQSGLAGLPPGVRRQVWITESDGPNFVPAEGSWARIETSPGLARFRCRTGNCWASLMFSYERTPTWNLDLEALGMLSLRFDVTGNMSPELPLSCYVLIEDYGDSPGDERFATLTRTITQPGEFIMRLAEFEKDPGFDFHDVDWIAIQFGNCDANGCSNLIATPNFDVAKFRFDTADAVPTRHSTWGRLKSGYR